MMVDKNSEKKEEQNEIMIKQQIEIERLKEELKKKEIDENIINVIAKNVEPLSKLISDIAEKWIKIKEGEATFSIRMGILAIIAVSMIVIVAALLTYFDKIDGATLTFLFGIIVGYMLTFIREAIHPPE